MRSSRGSEIEVEQRRQSVLRHVADEGEVRIDDLAGRLGVSVMTMHRDLDNLQERKLLFKRRGVATAFSTVTMESSLRFREHANREFKQAVGELLVDQVKPGSTVLVDCGSTLFPLAHRLGGIDGVRVVTNSLRVAQQLADSSAEVTLLGDRVHADFESCAGPEVLRALDRIRVDVAFVTATCVHEGKLFHPVREFAENKEAYLASADSSVLAVDHSKFGRTATYAYGDIGGYDLLVTDNHIPAAETSAAHRLGVDVRTVNTTAD